MDLLGWIVIGFIAGSISGWFVGTRSVQGCLPTIVVGVLGAIVGGWVAAQLNLERGTGFIAAVIVALIGAIIVRVILEAISPNDSR